MLLVAWWQERQLASLTQDEPKAFAAVPSFAAVAFFCCCYFLLLLTFVLLLWQDAEIIHHTPDAHISAVCPLCWRFVCLSVAR